MPEPLVQSSWRERLQSARMILIMLLVLAVLIAYVSYSHPRFLSRFNLENLGRRVALLSIYSIGGSLAIIAAGIDLSVGSLIGLVGVLLPLLLVGHEMPVWQALPLVLALGAALGLLHGVLIAKFNLQPFIVTLCALLAYRSIARTITRDMTQGFGASFEGLRQWAVGTWLHVPIALYIMLGVALVVGFFLHATVWGRHLYALGQNEEAARYSGIAVDRLKIAAYTISGFLAGVAGVLLALDTNSVQPADAGKSYELYGIAAAVLGGCSLRGGEGTVAGIIVGATILTVLRNLIILRGFSSYIEDALIAAVILGMVVVDEIIKRRARRKTGRAV
ncbi:MAG: ABC transporter permease [Candidatus Sumerlaeia bacterium]|nr:ABC transporter permease [Candidatus Sumerlaeia bacterium]